MPGIAEISKLAILTTDTIHHAYFVNQMWPLVDQCEVFVETDSIKPRYPIAHSFEQERDGFELHAWGTPTLRHVCDPIEFKNINNAAMRLRAFSPDLAVVFGTRRLNGELSASCPMLNLHGGNPQRYRGLDSHLWAIWHNDFASLETCLHEVAPMLDTGAVVKSGLINLNSVSELYQLRKANTELCIELTKQVIRERKFKGVAQNTTGRYYSFMPTDLKTTCVEKFRKYRESHELHSQAKAG